MELTIIKQLGEFGLLGVFLALVWWIAMRLWRELQRSWEERLAESRQLASVIETTNRSYAAMASATECRAQANEAMSHAQTATSEALAQQMKALNQIAESQERLSRDVYHLCIHLERMYMAEGNNESWSIVAPKQRARTG